MTAHEVILNLVDKLMAEKEKNFMLQLKLIQSNQREERKHENEAEM